MYQFQIQMHARVFDTMVFNYVFKHSGLKRIDWFLNRIQYTNKIGQQY